MVGKIFSILEGVKKLSTITKEASTTSVDKIVNEVTKGDIDPIEAYVMLDYLQKVTSEALKSVKTQALDRIQKEGENTAFGVQLQLVSRNDYKYEQDKEWSDINYKVDHYKNSLKARENFLKDVAIEHLKAGKESPIDYTTTIVIRPNYAS